MLALADLQGKAEEEIKKHLVHEYSGKGSGFDYYEITEKDREEAQKLLKNLKVVIAYESVGDYGCCSSGFYILTDGEKYFQINGSHCSCYGFEGQLELEEMPLEYYQSERFNFYGGGYDDEYEDHGKMIKEYLKSL